MNTKSKLNTQHATKTTLKNTASRLIGVILINQNGMYVVVYKQKVFISLTTKLKNIKEQYMQVVKK